MMPEPDRPALRQDAILDAAFTAFSTYGYRRTTMDDIAQGAGLSRSALYLHYRNKDDILRSLAARFFEDALTSVAAELGMRDRPIAEALTAAFVGYDGKFMDIVLGTPHRAEMMNAGQQVSADIVADGEAKIHALLAKWLEGQTIPAEIGDAASLASTILASLKGLKAAAKSPQGYRAAQAHLARIVARAVSH